MGYRFILASASPRRRELLKQIGVTFEVMPAKGEEVITKEQPEQAVMELSRQKAEEIARITQQSQEQMEAINGDYQKDLERLAQEIVGRMIGI